MIVVSVASRKRLRQALIKHRQSYPLSEAEYVGKVLKIALNTYKKCVDGPSSEELRLKRHTLVALLKHAKLDPKPLGIDITVPTAVDQFGGYDPQDFADLVGHYFIHRRSFLTAQNIVRGVVEIRINDEQRCLSFDEYNNYLSDAGLPDDNEYTGDIYINPERNLFCLLAFPQGQLRLMMTQNPVRSLGLAAGAQPRGGIRLRGALLTHGKPKGVWQPTFSAIAMESLPQSLWRNARTHCRTITPDDPEFAAISTELSYAEDHTNVITPLMWARNQSTARLANQSGKVGV